MTKQRITQATVDAQLAKHGVCATYKKGRTIGFYIKALGPAFSLRSKWEDGTPFKTWRDVLNYLNRN